MRIVCPSCSAAYDVPDSLVTAGRLVRCAHCDGEWMPVQAGAPEPEPVPPSTVDPPQIVAEPVATRAPPTVPTGSPPVVVEAAPRPSSAMDRLALQSAPPSSRLPLRLAWLASLALLAVLGWAAYARRAEIVDLWPPSARIYAVFGISPTPGRTH
jgi:predicted Zn finger-like uncharacterized protein